MPELIKLFFNAKGRYPAGNVQDELNQWAAEQLTTAQAEVDDLMIQCDRLVHANDRANDKNRDLMTENEALRARVAELESQHERFNVMAWLAVGNTHPFAEKTLAAIYEETKSAQRLRQQADEMESE